MYFYVFLCVLCAYVVKTLKNPTLYTINTHVRTPNQAGIKHR
jgi:hypothetical protein